MYDKELVLQLLKKLEKIDKYYLKKGEEKLLSNYNISNYLVEEYFKINNIDRQGLKISFKHNEVEQDLHVILGENNIQPFMLISTKGLGLSIKNKDFDTDVQEIVNRFKERLADKEKKSELARGIKIYPIFSIKKNKKKGAN